MKAYPPKKHYRWHVGFIAWLLHRITGVMLAIYLFVHIWVISHLGQGKQAFDQVMGFLQSPFFHVLEVGLLAAVMYHTINGVRVVLLDYGNAADKRKITPYFVATLVIVAAVTAVIGWFMLFR